MSKQDAEESIVNPDCREYIICPRGDKIIFSLKDAMMIPLPEVLFHGRLYLLGDINNNDIILHCLHCLSPARAQYLHALRALP